MALVLSFYDIFIIYIVAFLILGGMTFLLEIVFHFPVGSLWILYGPLYPCFTS